MEQRVLMLEEEEARKASDQELMSLSQSLLNLTNAQNERQQRAVKRMLDQADDPSASEIVQQAIKSSERLYNAELSHERLNHLLRVQAGLDWQHFIDPGTGKEFYKNLDSGELVWSRPTELLVQDEKFDAVQRRYMAMPRASLLRIMAFLAPGKERNTAALVCKKWRDAAHSPALCIWIDPVQYESLKRKSEETGVEHLLWSATYSGHVSLHYDRMLQEYGSGLSKQAEEGKYFVFRSVKEALTACSHGDRVVLARTSAHASEAFTVEQCISIETEGVQPITSHSPHYLKGKSAGPYMNISVPDKAVLRVDGSVTWNAVGGRLLGVSLRNVKADWQATLQEERQGTVEPVWAKEGLRGSGIPPDSEVKDPDFAGSSLGTPALIVGSTGRLVIQSTDVSNMLSCAPAIRIEKGAVDMIGSRVLGSRGCGVLVNRGSLIAVESAVERCRGSGCFLWRAVLLFIRSRVRDCGFYGLNEAAVSACYAKASEFLECEAGPCNFEPEKGSWNPSQKRLHLFDGCLEQVAADED